MVSPAFRPNRTHVGSLCPHSSRWARRNSEHAHTAKHSIFIETIFRSDTNLPQHLERARSRRGRTLANTSQNTRRHSSTPQTKAYFRLCQSQRYSLLFFTVFNQNKAFRWTSIVQSVHSGGETALSPRCAQICACLSGGFRPCWQSASVLNLSRQTWRISM